MLSPIQEPKEIDPDIKAYFLTVSEMYYVVNRGVEHCAKEDLFLQKPISTEDLIKEVNKKINSTS